MDAELTALLTSQAVNCTAEQISVFVAAEINNLNTLRALRDADFKDAGISVGTRVKVREALGQGAASSSEGGGSNCAGAQHRPPTQVSIVAYATSPAIAAATSAARSAAAASSSARSIQYGRQGGKAKAANAASGAMMRQWLQPRSAS